MTWYDSIRFGVAEILAAGTSLFWRGKLNFLAPLSAEDNSSLGTTDVGMGAGTVVGQLLAWTGSAWSASSVLRVLGSGDINIATSVFKFLDTYTPTITVEEKASGTGAAMYVAAQGTASGTGGQAQLIGGYGTDAGGVGRLSGGSASAGTGGDCVIATGDGSTADGSVKEYIGGTGGTLIRQADANGHNLQGKSLQNYRNARGNPTSLPGTGSGLVALKLTGDTTTLTLSSIVATNSVNTIAIMVRVEDSDGSDAYTDEFRFHLKHLSSTIRVTAPGETPSEGATAQLASLTGPDSTYTYQLDLSHAGDTLVFSLTDHASQARVARVTSWWDVAEGLS